MGAASRRALLIGVGDTPEAPGFPSLDAAVTADQRALQAALQAADYEVEVLRDPTRNRITERVTAAAREAEPGSTLLLHFTGHGLRIGGKDYLVPADARAPEDDDPADWDQPHLLESLVDADLSRYLRAGRAGTVLWLIDACRSPEDGGDTVFGSRITQGPPGGGFAVMAGCRAGQRSGYDDQGSYFTRALARAFDPLTEASTVEEVFDTAARLTTQLARRHGLQEPAVRYGDDLQAQTRATVVTRGRRLLESWGEAVDVPGLWERVRPADADLVPAFRAALRTLVETTARQVDHAQKRLPDPWADDEYPVRLLRDGLPRLLPSGPCLSALEAAALVAAVFLHEAAWADRHSLAAEVDPHRTGHRDDGDSRRRHYEQMAGHYPLVADKLRRRHEEPPAGEPLPENPLPEDPFPEDLDAVALWLVHRWIREQFETDEEPLPPEPATACAARLLGEDAARPGARAAELATALRTVAAGPALGAPTETQKLPRARHVVGSVTQTLRIRPLAALLRLAALLALDARTLPEVVAEHLAVSDPVHPREVIAALHATAWDQDTDTGDLHLDALCPHPAIHAALATLVEEADELAAALRESAADRPADDAKLLAALPPRITDRSLRPQDDDRGRRAYDVPLLRFTLAQTEVRRLLMGEDLYDGKRELALRELYQNAMDACRYRSMRQRYLRAVDRSPGPWDGAIRIATGEDERGRYVECRDNGIGMTVDQLKSTFTRAGRRFEQDREFRREQAAWLRHDRELKLYPNSRFGIGVFSYFMLAEEMTILTRPVGTDGRPAARALRVDISGSGSLFRIRDHDATGDEALLDGGTRIRLYLRDRTLLAGAACVDVLRELVRFSEFALEVRADTGGHRTWEPQVLQHTGAVEAVPGVLWWVPGEGAVLSDGIAADERPFGYVLNLTGPHRAELSVNRQHVKTYDRAWEAEQWHRGAYALATWRELDMEWIHDLESQNLPAARVIARELHGRGVRADSYGGVQNLDEVGWFHHDRLLDVGDNRRDPGGNHWEELVAWRTAVRRLPFPERVSGPTSWLGHPVPEPGWAHVATGVDRDWRSFVELAVAVGITVSAALRITRGLRIAHPRLAPPAQYADGTDWEPDDVDLRIARLLKGSHTAAGIRTYHLHGPQELAGLVAASADLGWSLGALVERCARYAPLLAAPVPPVPPHHRDQVCTGDDLTLLYVMGPTGRRAPAEGPWDVATAADRLRIDPAEACRRLAAFGWLGWRTWDADSVAPWAAVPRERRDRLRAYLRVTPAGAELPGVAAIRFAADHRVPVAEANAELLVLAERLALPYRPLCPADDRAHEAVPTPLMAQIAERLPGTERSPRTRSLQYLTPRQVQVGNAELAEALEALRSAGATVPAASVLVPGWADLPAPARHAFGSGTGLPGVEQARLPTPPTLLAGSAGQHAELAYLWDIARSECERLGVGEEFTPPELPAELRSLRPGPAEVDALTLGIGRWTPLSPRVLVAYALRRSVGVRQAYEALLPYRAIGAPVPELTEEALAGLPDAVPEPRDVAYLTAEYRASPAGEPLVPLDLVSVAGRLGESTAAVWARLAPYLPFEAAPPRIDPGAVPDVLPHWQDLAILSEGLDGMLPAACGAVTAERLAFAAEGVGESPAWVHARLLLYAELFDLTLPAAPAAGSESEDLP